MAEEHATGCLSDTRRATDFFCKRLSPTPSNCLRDIHDGLLLNLKNEEEARWIKAGPVGVDYYQMLRVPGDSNNDTVYKGIQRVGVSQGVPTLVP